MRVACTRAGFDPRKSGPTHSPRDHPRDAGPTPSTPPGPAPQSWAVLCNGPTCGDAPAERRPMTQLLRLRKSGGGGAMAARSPPQLRVTPPAAASEWTQRPHGDTSTPPFVFPVREFSIDLQHACSVPLRCVSHRLL